MSGETQRDRVEQAGVGVGLDGWIQRRHASASSIASKMLHPFH